MSLKPWGGLGAGRPAAPALAEAAASRQAQASAVAHAAFQRDPETGLPNRQALEAAVLRRAAGDDPRSLFVAAFGVDGFERMRAALGYGLVADLMRALAERLKALEPAAEVARVSADALSLAFQAADLNEACARAEAARRSLQTVQTVGEHLIDVRLTVGLGAGRSPAALVREADLALDAARSQGRRALVFDPAAHAAAVQALSLMPELRRAIASNRLAVAHQPKLDLRTREICGVETLVRWRHPDLGWVSPDAFIPLAEETGDIRALTDWVLERALAEQAALAAAGRPLSFAVNLSGRLLCDAEAIAHLVTRVREASGPITLEVTETAVIADPEVAIANLNRLRAAGVALSIDDYGAGLSSLAYLRRLPAQELKLDRSLLGDLAGGGRDVLVIRSTIDLAHALGMKVVAEGIEDRAVLAVLAGMGCDQAQGFAIARPLPFAELKRFLGVGAPERETTLRATA